MSGYTPEQEIELSKREIRQWIRERDQHQQFVDMFNNMIADNKRRIAEARAKTTYCPCGWKPREGIIGGETLEEHQVFCRAATESNEE